MAKKTLMLTLLILMLITIAGCGVMRADQFVEKEGIDFDNILHVQEIALDTIVFYDYNI